MRITCLLYYFITALEKASILIGDNGPVLSPTATTRVGCRVVVRCSGLGVSVVWRRFGSRQPLETGGNTIISVRFFYRVDSERILSHREKIGKGFGWGLATHCILGDCTYSTSQLCECIVLGADSDD